MHDNNKEAVLQLLIQQHNVRVLILSFTSNFTRILRRIDEIECQACECVNVKNMFFFL